MIESQILTLGTIFDYIDKYYPSLLFWDGYSKHEPRDHSKSYKHRAGMPNEIRIEFDSEDIEQNWVNINLTCMSLWNAGFNFAIFYVEGGRSPHIHIYDVDELDNFTLEQRTEYRKKFLTKYCPPKSNPDYGLCDEKHLCALEFAMHFKYNKPKQLLSFFKQGALNNQGCDYDIVLNITNKKKSKKLNLPNNRTLKFGDILKQKVRDIIIQELNFETIFDKYGIEYKGKMALCPFHADKDKSLSFSSDKGLWKCFGCNAKGDIITLIQKLKEKKNGDKKTSN